jgi:DNA invertase Pin-like site-specific DNA recombinase
MTETIVGYARCSTDAQDLAGQRDRLREVGVAEDRTYLDHGLTGTSASARAWTRPWPPSAAATRS